MSRDGEVCELGSDHECDAFRNTGAILSEPQVTQVLEDRMIERVRGTASDQSTEVRCPVLSEFALTTPLVPMLNRGKCPGLDGYADLPIAARMLHVAQLTYERSWGS